MDYRPPRDCERKAVKHADLADTARALGHVEEANEHLLLAWAAYDGLDEALGAEPADETAVHEVCPFPRR